MINVRPTEQRGETSYWQVELDMPFTWEEVEGIISYLEQAGWDIDRDDLPAEFNEGTL